jgi:hypothetical protein
VQRIARHATRLAAANDSEPESDFSIGQRVVADGFGGVVSAVEPGYARGSETYRVTLDGGMGGGDYSAGQLRTAAYVTTDQARQWWLDSPEAGMRAEDVLAAQASGIHVASEDYPEMGTILFDRPDPGRQVTVIGSLARTAATDRPFYDDPEHVYRGLAVRLPPEVHAKVHDQNLPEHERGFHLARHLLTHPHPDVSGGLGRHWSYDSFVASVIHAEQEGSRPATHTPVILKGRMPDRDDVEDEDEHGVTVRPGASVPLTSISWGHPNHDRPGATEEGDGDHWLDFPEPIRAKASLQREAADGSVYHGKNYYLPHSLYNHVTDPSRPEHERGHALARYLAGFPHDHGGMGVEWTDDASAAMGSAHYQGDNPWNVKDGAEKSGEHDWGVPVVYHAAPHDESSYAGPHDDIPHEAINSEYYAARERMVKPGSPVRWTGVSWSEQPGNEESRSRDHGSRPRAPEEADASHWRHFRFPEGMQVKASLRREAAWYDEGEPHAHELGGSVYRGMPVYLPTDLHRKVHDESRPVHERALLLARHVMASQPRWTNGGVGTSWSRNMSMPAWQATTQEPHYDEHVEADHAYGRLARDHTPVILHARTPGPEHRDEDQEALHRRDREGGWVGDDDYDPEPSEYPLRGNLHVKEGHPVGLSGISWARPGHYGQEPPEGSPNWSHHEFPEPVTVKASLRPRTALRWIAADQSLELS